MVKLNIVFLLIITEWYGVNGQLPLLVKSNFENNNLFEKIPRKFLAKENLFLENHFGSKKLYVPEDNLKGRTSRLEYYLPLKAESLKCKSSLNNLMKPNNAGVRLKFIDSWGKLPDGILWGNYNPVGMYEECLQIDHDELQGRYCYVQLVNSAQNASDESKAQMPTSDFTLNSPQFLNSFYYGTCIPRQCTEQDMKESLMSSLSQPESVAAVSCHSLNDKIPLTASDIALIVFLSFLVFTAVLSSIIDFITYRNGHRRVRRGYLRFLLMVSLWSNVRKLFDTSSKPQRGNISCLHGIRVLSMLWVIYGHQNIVNERSTENLFDVPRQTDGILYQFILNGTFSVDSFFFLSGFLLSLLTLKVLKKTEGKLNLGLFYLHRIIRLTPAIAITVWFFATLSRYLANGPYSLYFLILVENCRTTWWTDLLFINNYALSITGRHDCLMQGWYNAADTQIFLLTPLILLPLYHYKTWGKVWFAFLTIASCVIPASITVGLDLPPFNKLNNDPHAVLQYNLYLYKAPFSRAGPYFIGMWVGYLMYKRQDLLLKRWMIVLGWILSTFLALAILLGMWNYNQLSLQARTDWSVGTQFFYGGFSRTLWAVPLAWIVIACHYGYGGPVNSFLSLPVFIPLSRLTYAMFLVAVGIQILISSNRKQMFYFSHLNNITETCGTLFFTCISALILSVLIETPIMNLEKELLRKTDLQTKKTEIIEPSFSSQKITQKY